MRNRIEYKEGDVVGNNGCSFIEEIEPHEAYNGRVRRKAIFKCPECGNLFESTIEAIRGNNTRSCGCSRSGINYKHGIPRKHKIYNLWSNIKTRCYNKNSEHYHNYGGRGITMFEPWINDFISFHDHIINLPHYDEPGMTLDRENNDKGYFPGNLRWADRITQAANKRTTKICLTK